MSELSSSSDPERDQRLGEAVAAYFAAVEAGEAPDRDAILAANPDLAADLAEFFDHEERLGRLVAPIRSTERDEAGLGDETLTEPRGSKAELEAGETSPSAGDSTVAIDGAVVDRDGQALDRGVRVRYFGDYELISVLGRGGMGIVYKANQLSLNRVVALKMIRSGHWADDEEVRRFRNEAEAIANLDHPLILPIYEVGRYEDQHYFSMKLVPGGSLENRLGELQADVRAAAKLAADVARALHHAHQRGLLHRDLKPSNILLDPEGRPHVADFGLAKRIEADGAASVSGSIVGTPSYMSPEQAGGRRGSVTTATDVYGIGALLYACLTGRPPFQSDDVVTTLRLVTDQPPEPPSKSNPRVDRDLETICLKCLEKDPKRRYDSAPALADDLDRWLRGEPILARRTGSWERVLKWSRRRPTSAALVAMSGVAAIMLIGLGVAYYIHSQLRSAYDEVDLQRAIADRQRAIAEGALDSERTFLYQNCIMFAERQLNDNAPHATESLLEECPADRRNWEWHYLKRQCHVEVKTIEAHKNRIWSLPVSLDGRLIVTAADQDGKIRIWDVDEGRERYSLSSDSDSYTFCDLSPDGKIVASVGGSLNDPGAVLIREVETGKTLQSIPLNAGYISSVSFDTDARRIVVASGEINPPCWVRVYDVQTAQVVLSIETGEDYAYDASFSPDGKSIVAIVGSTNTHDTAGKLNEARIWDVETKAAKFVLKSLTTPLIAARFSPDGKRIATAGYDAVVRIYDAVDGRERISMRGHQSCVNQVAFSPDGRRIASTSDDGSAKIWDVETGRELSTYRGHRGGVFAVSFSPDGRRLHTSGYDGALKVWDATSSPEALTFRAASARVSAVAFSPDGLRLVTASVDRALRFWERRTGKLLATWEGHTEPIWDVAFSPDGTRVASTGGDWKKADQLGEVNIWDVATGRVVHTLRAHNAVSWCLAFSPDGGRLATGGGEYRTAGQ